MDTQTVTVVYGSDPQSDATIEQLETAGIPYTAVAADSDQGRRMLSESAYPGPPAVYAHDSQWCGHRPDKIDDLTRGQRKSRDSFLGQIARKAGELFHTSGKDGSHHEMGKERHGR